MEKDEKEHVRRPVGTVCVTVVRSDNSLARYGAQRWRKVDCGGFKSFDILPSERQSSVPCPLVWAEHSDHVNIQNMRKQPLPQRPMQGTVAFSLRHLLLEDTRGLCQWGCTAMEELSGGTEASFHLPAWTGQARVTEPTWKWKPESSEASRNWSPRWHLTATSWGTLSRSPQLSCSQLLTKNKN